MNYFFDNNFSPRLVYILRELGVDVTALRDQFPPDTKDRDFLPHLNGDDHVFVTCDKRILTRQIEALALKECGVSAVFFKNFWPNMGIWEQAQWITRHWRTIEATTNGFRSPSYFEVNHNGKLVNLTLRF